MKRLEAAPAWDLCVLDEAHHLTAYKSGGKVTRTENYKLAECLRAYCRDLILLSATPINNDLYDLASQVRLFTQSRPDYFREAGIGDLTAYFRHARRIARTRGAGSPCAPISE